MPFKTLKKNILDHHLCASCGLCEVVCPHNLLIMQGHEPGLITSGSDSSCGSCNLCADVCPGWHTRVSESELAIFGRTRTRDERWLGIFERSLFGRARDPDLYAMSSSGGCATALLLEAKRELDIDYIMAAGRRNDKPWLAAPQICSNKEELCGVTQQSTYQMFPHLCGLKSLLRMAPEARIAIIALPCQIQALRKLQSLNGPLAEYARSKIAFIIEIACSSNTVALATERLITEFLRISLDEVKDVRYRDGDYPGDFCVYTKQNGRYIIEFWKAVDFFKEHKTHRCLSCGDWMSGLADLSLCDGDPNIFMSSAIANKRLIKHGRILVRTLVGNLVVDKAIATGAIDILDVQLDRMNLGLERKRNRRAHYECSGMIIPDPPIRGYAEETEPISDDYLLKLSRMQNDESIQMETFKYAGAQRKPDSGRRSARRGAEGKQ